MAQKVLKSVKGRRIRVTRLDECGLPVEGSCTTLVTDGFIQVVLSAEVEAGEEMTQKNAWGDFCISEKDSDRFKWVNVTINFCEVNPNLVDIIGGDSVVPIVGASTTTIGFQVNANGNAQSFALELWTKAAGQDACEGGTVEWGYFVVPFITNGRIDGDITVENGPLTFSMRGDGQQDVGWGENPYGDNPLIETGGIDTGSLWAQVRTTVQPPALTADCVAYAAP